MYSNYPDYLSHSYGYENMENAGFFPSTFHANDTLTRYNFKYLFQRAISVFDFGIPDFWEKNFFLNTLYGIGYIIVINSEKYGILPQFGNIYGYDLQYQPARATVVNPLFTGEDLKNFSDMKIWKDCGIIRLSTSYTGISDICRYYAQLLSTAQTSLHVNLVNTKFAYLFGAKNKAQAETFKRIYDDIASGQTAVVTDKNLFDEEGKLAVALFTQDVQSVYIGDHLINDIRNILNDFDSMIGIPNTNTQKKERMIVDEINMNNFETDALCLTWLEMIKQDMKRCNEMYNLNLTVKFRKGDSVYATGNDNPADIVPD